MKRSRKSNGSLSKLLLFALFFVGVLVALYPFYINALNGVIDQYQLSRLQGTIKEQERAFQAKEKANQEIRKRGLQPGVVDFSQSNLSEQDQAYYKKHLLGKVVIPSLSLAIPFFDETNQHLLNRGQPYWKEPHFPLVKKIRTQYYRPIVACQTASYSRTYRVSIKAIFLFLRCTIVKLPMKFSSLKRSCLKKQKN